MTLASIYALLCLAQCDGSKLELRVGPALVEPGVTSLTVPVAIHGVTSPFPDIFVLGLRWDPAVLALEDVRAPADVPQNPFNAWDQMPEQGLARVLHLGSWELESSYLPADGRAVLVWLVLDVLARRDTVVKIEPSTSQELSPWWYTQLYYCGEMWTFLKGEGRPRIDGNIAFRPESPPFLRGDVDGNGRLDLSDAIRTLSFLFEGQDGVDCEDAADVDDDGAITITDAVYLGTHLFLAGPPPRPPSPEAGPDPTPDEMGCARPAR